MPPGDDGGDQRKNGDDFGEARAPAAAGDGWRRGFGALGLAAFVLGHEMQAVDQPRQAAQALHHVLGGAADGGARAEMGLHPFLDQGPRQLPDVDVGIEPRAHALGHQHGLLQQQELRLHRHLELLGDAQQVRQQAGDRDLMAGLAEDRLADRAAGLGEHLARLVGRHVARAELHLGHGAIVAAQEGDQQLGEIAARVLVDAAHDAEIDRHDVALAIDEGVAAMHVGMEEAVAEHLVEEGLGALLHDDIGIVAGGDDGVAIADRDAVDALQRQHALGGAVPVDGRARDSRDRRRSSRPAPRRPPPPCAGPSRRARRRRRRAPNRPASGGDSAAGCARPARPSSRRGRGRARRRARCPAAAP